MGSYFNMGTEQKPRWINLENVSVISAMKIKAPGQSEVRFRGNGHDKDELVCGEAADRLIDQLKATRP